MGKLRQCNRSIHAAISNDVLIGSPQRSQRIPASHADCTNVKGSTWYDLVVLLQSTVWGVEEIEAAARDEP